MHGNRGFITGALAAMLVLTPVLAPRGAAETDQRLLVKGSISINGGQIHYWFSVKDTANQPIHGALVKVNDLTIPEAGSGDKYAADVSVNFAAPIVLKLSIRPPHQTYGPLCFVDGIATFSDIVSFVKPANGKTFLRNSGPGIPFQWRITPGPARVILNVFDAGNSVVFYTAGLTLGEYVVPWSAIPPGQAQYHATVETSGITNMPLTGSVAPGSLVSAKSWSRVDFTILSPAPLPKTPLKK